MSEEGDVRVTSLGDGRMLVEHQGTRQIAYAVADGRHTWVFLEGRTFVVGQDSRADRRGPGRHHHDDETALSSPMPAMVVSVNVAVGQAVSQGDLMVMLEAMKMELPIRAPRNGRVKAIACRQGELVQPGIPLLELE